MPEKARHRECEKFELQEKINKDSEKAKMNFIRENRELRLQHLHISKDLDDEGQRSIDQKRRIKDIVKKVAIKNTTVSTINEE